MRNRLIKFGAVLAGMLSVALLAPLAWAWACTSLATVDLKPAAGVTGAEIAGVGYGFDTGAVGPGPASVEPVEVHWNSTSGPLLARVAPSSDGSIHFSFKAPAGAPAYYTVIATQNDATGQPVAGTPARASFALNNPPRQAVSGAELAGSVDRETAGHGAPSAIVHDQAQVAASAQAVRPNEALPAIAPSGARSRDVFGLASAGSAGSQLGLAVMGLGAAMALIAAAVVVTPGFRRAKQRS